MACVCVRMSVCVLCRCIFQMECDGIMLSRACHPLHLSRYCWATRLLPLGFRSEVIFSWFLFGRWRPLLVDASSCCLTVRRCWVSGHPDHCSIEVEIRCLHLPELPSGRVGEVGDPVCTSTSVSRACTQYANKAASITRRHHIEALAQRLPHHWPGTQCGQSGAGSGCRCFLRFDTPIINAAPGLTTANGLCTALSGGSDSSQENLLLWSMEHTSETSLKIREKQMIKDNNYRRGGIYVCRGRG